MSLREVPEWSPSQNLALPGPPCPNCTEDPRKTRNHRDTERGAVISVFPQPPRLASCGQRSYKENSAVQCVCEHRRRSPSPLFNSEQLYKKIHDSLIESLAFSWLLYQQGCDLACNRVSLHCTEEMLAWANTGSSVTCINLRLNHCPSLKSLWQFWVLFFYILPRKALTDLWGAGGKGSIKHTHQPCPPPKKCNQERDIPNPKPNIRTKANSNTNGNTSPALARAVYRLTWSPLMPNAAVYIGGSQYMPAGFFPYA